MQSRNGTLGRIAGGRKHLVIYRRSRPSLLDGQRTGGGKEDGAIRPQQACAGNGIPSGAFDQVRAAQLGRDDAGLRGRSWHGDEPRRILRDRLLQTSTFVILSLRSPKRDGRTNNREMGPGTCQNLSAPIRSLLTLRPAAPNRPWHRACAFAAQFMFCFCFLLLPLPFVSRCLRQKPPTS